VGPLPSFGTPLQVPTGLRLPAVEVGLPFSSSRFFFVPLCPIPHHPTLRLRAVHKSGFRPPYPFFFAKAVSPFTTATAPRFLLFSLRVRHAAGPSCPPPFPLVGLDAGIRFFRWCFFPTLGKYPTAHSFPGAGCPPPSPLLALSQAAPLFPS